MNMQDVVKVNPGTTLKYGYSKLQQFDFDQNNKYLQKAFTAYHQLLNSQAYRVYNTPLDFPVENYSRFKDLIDQKSVEKKGFDENSVEFFENRLQFSENTVILDVMSYDNLLVGFFDCFHEGLMLNCPIPLEFTFKSASDFFLSSDFKDGISGRYFAKEIGKCKYKFL